MEEKIRTPFASVLLIIRIVLLFLNLLAGSTFFSILDLLLDVALCYVLFTKRREILFVGVLGAETLLSLFYFVRSFTISSLLFLVSDGFLFVFSLSVCEQSLIKLNLGKFKDIAGKIFFLPALLSLVAPILNIFIYDYIRITDFILIFVNVAISFSIALWLKDPCVKTRSVSEETKDGTFVEETYDDAYCGLGKHIVLCLFTFGIWYLIWTHRTTKYLNKAPGAQWYNPTSKLLLCMFVPFYQIFWFYKHGQRLDAMSKQKNLNNSDMATLCLILGIFIPIVACILMQDRINILCTTKAVVEEKKAEDSATDELKKFKVLLDQGIITQEEFDAKKKELLGL